MVLCGGEARGAAVCFPGSPRLCHFEESSLGVSHRWRLSVVLLKGAGCVGGGGRPVLCMFSFLRGLHVDIVALCARVAAFRLVFYLHVRRRALVR